MLKIVPLLTAFGGKKSKAVSSLAKWTESDDINLLEGIEAQEVAEVDEGIDFTSSALNNDYSLEDN